MAKPSLLAIYAHPDDEIAVAPLLAKYAAEGHDVFLAMVTSGQKGFRPHFGMPPGDELGRVREEEIRGSARAMGIHEPFLLGFQDQGISTNAAAQEVAARLREIVDRVRADVLLTWGPDGITGHPDHRMCTNIVEILFQQQGLLAYKPSKLYFVAFPESKFAVNPNPLNRKAQFLTVSDEFVTTEVECGPYFPAALEAMRCHKTQWRPERVLEVHAMYRDLFEAKVYLRRAMSRVPGRASGREESIFEGLALSER